MRILSIAAGAAGMYCGSCFRDNAIATELLAQGHDVTLVPVYTPLRTDEPSVSRPRVLLGGISVYLQHSSPIFRKLPRAFDRLWDAPWIIKAFANRASSSTDAAMLGGLTISTLEGERGALKKEFEKLVEWARSEPLPDVVNLPNSLLISMAAPLRRALNRPVCCTLSGEELFLDSLVSPYRDRALGLMREQVAHVDRFIAVSEYCARFMSDLLRIPAGRMAVVPLGINLSGYEPRRDERRSDFRIGYFARVAPEKGLHMLADAYIRFRRQTAPASARLLAAGYMASNAAPYLAGVKEKLSAAGLAHEFDYRGEVDRAGKLAFMREIDVLSVPATYDEPKGLFLLEAMAAGVPVVQPRRGGFTEIVESTGGGLLVAPDSPDELAAGFHGLWSDPARLRQLGDRAYAGVRAHYTIAQSAHRLVDVYTRVTASTAALSASVA